MLKYRKNRIPHNCPVFNLLAFSLQPLAFLSIVVKMAAYMARCFTTIPDGVTCTGAETGANAGAGAGGTKVRGWSSLFSFCTKAARAAAWAGLSAARTEMKPAPRRTHKPKTILVFMK